MKDRSKALLRTALICGCLWTLLVLGIGAAVYFNKPWAMTLWSSTLAGNLRIASSILPVAHCALRPITGATLSSALKST